MTTLASKQRILVVDDSPDNREAVADLLRFDGYDVMEAADGASALKIDAQFDPHVYLLDVVMPGMSGLDLLKQLCVKEHPYEAIMMTGHESLHDARAAMELGAVSYVSKPIKHEELQKHVRAALEQVAVNERELAYRESLEREVRVRTKELEDTLHLTELQSQRLDMVLNSMQEGLVALDMEGRVMQLNAAAVPLLGITKGNLLGHRLEEALPEDVVRQLTEIPGSCTADGLQRSHIKVSDRTLTLVVGTLHDTSRQPMGRILTFADETDRVKSEQLRTAFLGIVAHEFRTPLQIILSNAATVGSAAVSADDRAEIAADIVAASKRLASLVDGIMRTASLSARTMNARLSCLDVHELIADRVKEVLRRYAAKAVRVTGVEHIAAATVFTDGGVLSDALDCVIDNAVKFSPDRGKVAIDVRAEGSGAIAISITDHGGGIAPDNVKRVFDWFTQAEDHLTRTQGGIGLGLALAKRAMELIGGTITVRTEVGTGSTFSLRVPTGA